MSSLCFLRGFSGVSLASSSVAFPGTCGASCAEPSGARFRAADEAFIRLVIARAHQESNGKGEVQSASLLSRSDKRSCALIPLTRFPFLLAQVWPTPIQLGKKTELCGGSEFGSFFALWEGSAGASSWASLGPFWELFFVCLRSFSVIVTSLGSLGPI